MRTYLLHYKNLLHISRSLTALYKPVAITMFSIPHSKATFGRLRISMMKILAEYRTTVHRTERSDGCLKIQYSGWEA